MGIFGKRRKNDEAFKIQLEREAMERMNHDFDDDFMLPFDRGDTVSEWNISGKTKAPNVLTPEELLGKPQPKKEPAPQTRPVEATGEVETIPMSHGESAPSASAFLYRRMTESRKQSLEKSIAQEEPIAAPKAEKSVEAKQSVEKEVKQPEDKDEIEQPETKVAKTPAVETAAPKSGEPFDLESALRSLRQDAQRAHTQDAPAQNDGKADISELKTTGFSENQPSAADASSATPGTSHSDDVMSDRKETVADSKAVSAQKPAPLQSNDSKTQTIGRDSAHQAASSRASAPTQAVKSAEERRTSLLARCNAYLQDDEFGTAKIDTEKYKLESVESILQDFEARASQRVMRNLQVKPQSGETTGRAFAPAADRSASYPASRTDSPTSDTSRDKKGIKSGQTAPQNGTSVNNAPLSSGQAVPSSGQADEVKHYFVSPTTGAPARKRENDDLSATRIVPATEPIVMKKEPPVDRGTQVFSPVPSAAGASAAQSEKPAAGQTDDPTEPSQESAASALADYNNIADRERVLESLSNSKSRLTTRLVLNLLLLIPAVLLLTPVGAFVRSLGTTVFGAVNVVICLLAICFNFNIMKSIPSLFSSSPDSDLPAALALVVVLIHGIVLLAFQSTALPLSAVALLTVCFSTASKRGAYSRIIKNFLHIADAQPKQAISVVTNKAAVQAMVSNAIEGSALVCYGADTTNLSDFLKYSFCGDPVRKKTHNLALVGMILGVGLGLASAILTTGDIPFAFTVFAAMLCIAASPAVLLIAQLPLRAAAGRLRKYDAMLTGYRAASELDHCNAIAVDCKDLFPEGSIRLVDMKLLSPNPIDQSILDAAALAEAMGSPVAGMFRQINNTAKTHALKVDSAVYEEKMGISGWVDDRRVFIGNRILMEAHGFASLPPVELDKKIMRKGYFPIYLVSNNVPCAMFVVKYLPDEEITYELRRLCSTGTTVLVHNCDPNISARMLCDYFGVYEETVAIMSKQGTEQFRILTAHKDSRSAGAACKGNVCGLLASLTAAINIRRSVSVMTVLYVTLVVLGFAALVALTFTPLSAQIGAVPLLGYQLLSSLIICLPPLLRRP